MSSLCAATALLAYYQPASAAPGGMYYRIEEDWELVLNTPDLSFPAPQIVVAMKPGVASTKQALFLINHHDTPQFNAGGGQIQVWDGDVLKSYKSFQGPTLIRVGEVVRWTQYMERSGGKFQYGLSYVEGDAWGVNTAADLGGPVYFSDIKTIFDAYDSDNSVHDAAITFGADRVNSLKLVEVRKYKPLGGIDVEGSQTIYASP
jgi:hypothetical protein